MTYADLDEAMDSLKSHLIVDCGGDGHAYHIELDDGCKVIFLGMAILLPEEYAVH